MQFYGSFRLYSSSGSRTLNPSKKLWSQNLEDCLSVCTLGALFLFGLCPEPEKAAQQDKQKYWIPGVLGNNDISVFGGSWKCDICHERGAKLLYYLTPGMACLLLSVRAWHLLLVWRCPCGAIDRISRLRPTLAASPLASEQASSRFCISSLGRLLVTTYPSER